VSALPSHLADMHADLPRFLLYTRPNGDGSSRHKSLKRWSFRLIAEQGAFDFEATDFEADVTVERLSLLAVVRGLEALDQPSHVTLMNPGRVVSRGLRFGLEQWRATGWRWERFGQMTLIRNADLWQRIDAALAFHRLKCRRVRVDAPQPVLRGPHFARKHRRRQRNLMQFA